MCLQKDQRRKESVIVSKGSKLGWRWMTGRSERSQHCAKTHQILQARVKKRIDA